MSKNDKENRLDYVKMAHAVQEDVISLFDRLRMLEGILTTNRTVVDTQRANMGKLRDSLKSEVADNNNLSARLAETSKALEIAESALRELQETTATPAPKKRCLIIVGHKSYAEGAYSKHLDASEFGFWGSWAINPQTRASLKRTVPAWEFDIATSDTVNTLTTVYDLIVELHFNAFSKASVKGAEVLVRDGRARDVLIAGNWLTGWCFTSGIKGRGVKALGSKERGYRNVNRMVGAAEDTPYLLLEPFFGTNKADCASVTQETLSEARGFRTNVCAEVVSHACAAFDDFEAGGNN